jgi:predicted Zn-dependent peptidase
MSSALEIYPKERWTLLVSCRPSREDGLPAQIVPEEPAKAVETVRATLESALKGKVSAKELKIYQDLLLKQATYESGRPDAIQAAILARYSYGKDLTSKYKTLIPGLTAASVEAFLTDFAEGSKVEYIVSK